MLSAGRLFSKTPSLRWLWPSPTTAKPPQHRLAFSSVAAAAKQVSIHNGSFHCDGALACFLLRLTNKFAGADVIRTQDLQKVLYSLDAVVDVGGVNDRIRDRYDHHQQGFGQVLGHGFTTKLSNAGLVYKHYGIEIISKELRFDEGHPNVHWLFPAPYKNFVEPINAIDNWVNQYDSDQPPKYVNNTSLSSRVGRLNLDWVDIDQSSKKENEAFNRAMELAGGEFFSTLNFYAKSWLPGSINCYGVSLSKRKY